MAVAQEHYESYKSTAHTVTDEDIFQNQVGGRKAIHLPQLVVDQQSEHLEHRHVGTEQQGSSTINDDRKQRLQRRETPRRLDDRQNIC